MARRGHRDVDYLFARTEWHDVQDSQRQRLTSAIDNAAPSVIQSGTVDEVAEGFVSEFQLAIPVLIEGAVSVDLQETKVDVTGDFRYGHFRRGLHMVPGIRASYFVPFTGDANMFQISPTMWSSVHPVAAIERNELRFTFERPGQPVDETKNAFEEELELVKTNLARLQTNVGEYNNGLLPLARQRITARRSRLEAMHRGGSSLGIPIRGATRPPTATRPSQAAPGPSQARPVYAPPGTDTTHERRYDVAFSFAGENRAYVEEVAALLRNASVDVFYDNFERADLWGKNLIDHLAKIYSHETRYVVMFISKQYVEKAWPTHERQHAQERALLANEEYILPARFDDTEMPGMTNTVGHVDLRRTTPAELADLILEKLGKKPR